MKLSLTAHSERFNEKQLSKLTFSAKSFIFLLFTKYFLNLTKNTFNYWYKYLQRLRPNELRYVGGNFPWLLSLLKVCLFIVLKIWPKPKFVLRICEYQSESWTKTFGLLLYVVNWIENWTFLKLLKLFDVKRFEKLFFLQKLFMNIQPGFNQNFD